MRGKESKGPLPDGCGKGRGRGTEAAGKCGPHSLRMGEGHLAPRVLPLFLLAVPSSLFLPSMPCAHSSCTRPESCSGAQDGPWLWVSFLCYHLHLHSGSSRPQGRDCPHPSFPWSRGPSQCLGLVRGSRLLLFLPSTLGFSIPEQQAVSSTKN